MSVLPKVPTIYEQGVTDDAYAIAGFVGMAAACRHAQGRGGRAVRRHPGRRAGPQGQGAHRRRRLPARLSSPEGFAKTYAQAAPVWKSLIEVADARVD